MEDCIRYFETELEAEAAFQEGIYKPFLGTIGNAIIHTVDFDNISFDAELSLWEEDGEYYCGLNNDIENEGLLTFGETPLE